jgi:hypothetical protein
MSDSESHALGASLKAKRVRLPIAVPQDMDYDLIALSSMAGVSKATMVRMLVGEAIQSRKQAGIFPGSSRPQLPPQPDSEMTLAEEETAMREPDLSEKDEEGNGESELRDRSLVTTEPSF